MSDNQKAQIQIGKLMFQASSCAIWDPAVGCRHCTEQLNSMAEHSSHAWPLLLELASVVVGNGHL